MSLINEALKRTRDASFSGSAAPAAVPSYRAQSGVESSGSKGTLLVTVLVATIAVAGFVGLASRVASRVQGLNDGLDPSPEATSAVPKTKPPEPPANAAPAPVASTKVQPIQAEPAATTPAADSKAGEDQLVARVVEKIRAEQAAAAPATPELPKFVLQGITYATDGSVAMINGLSVREGEDIEGAHVVAIDRRTVKLDCGGREVVLRLP
ncbi:MAG TPA: hypothetical protein VL486_06260 [Verrucomicrobiae bacterium]|nr:hypothetical protein [Verrucomicrobiae bacterium]